jgi:hypothetical protein
MRTSVLVLLAFLLCVQATLAQRKNALKNLLARSSSNVGSNANVTSAPEIRQTPKTSILKYMLTKNRRVRPGETSISPDGTSPPKVPTIRRPLGLPVQPKVEGLQPATPGKPASPIKTALKGIKRAITTARAGQNDPGKGSPEDKDS